MRDIALKIVLSIACFTALVACESWNEGFSPADHFIRNTFSLGYSGAADFHKDHDAVFDVCIKSFNEPLTKIDLNVTLPPDVKLLRGDLRWKGNIGERSQKCLRLQVYSKKDMRDWSSPITIHVEFLYKGEKIIGDEKRSYECNQRGCPTLWTKNGNKIDSYEEIDKDKWLSEQKQGNER